MTVCATIFNIVVFIVAAIILIGQHKGFVQK